MLVETTRWWNVPSLSSLVSTFYYYFRISSGWRTIACSQIYISPTLCRSRFFVLPSLIVLLRTPCNIIAATFSTFSIIFIGIVIITGKYPSIKFMSFPILYKYFKKYQGPVSIWVKCIIAYFSESSRCPILVLPIKVAKVSTDSNFLFQKACSRFDWGSDIFILL